MSNEMNIEIALSNLDAGRFSFRMVDAIRSHIAKLESEAEIMRGAHAEAIQELKQQEYANWRLENELTKLNAKINLLIRTNAIVEKALLDMAPIKAKAGDFLAASGKYAAEALSQAAADLKAGKLPPRVVEAYSKLLAFIEANKPAVEKAIRDFTPVAREYFEFARKHAAASIGKATTYISTLNKTA